MKVMTIRMFCMAWVFGLVQVLQAATISTYTWSGNGADAKWSTAENWKEGVAPKPDEGAILIFEPTADTAIVTENDQEDFWVRTLRFSEGKAVTLNGKRINIHGASMMWSNQCDVTCNADLALNGSHYLHVWGTNNIFNGTIVVGTGETIYLGDASNWQRNGKNSFAPSICFYGDIVGTNCTWDSHRCGSGVRPVDYYYGSVNVSRFTMAGSTCGGHVYFCNAVNACTNLYGSYDEFHFMKPNQFPANTDVKLYDGKYGGQSLVLHASQTFRNLEATANTVGSKYFSPITDDGTAHTLTFRADRDTAVPALRISSKVSFIWAPVGDFTLTQSYVTNTTSGTLSVSNGMYCVADGAAFTTSFGGIHLYNESKFKVAATASEPFSKTSTATRFYLHNDSQLVLDGDVTVYECFVRGLPLASGAYTKATLGDVISGEGTLTVRHFPTATYWQGVPGAAWNHATNWTAGLPSSTVAAQVTREGDYVIPFDTNKCESTITLAAQRGRPVVEISHDATLKGKIYLGDASGNGGVLRVTGGTVAHTNSFGLYLYPNGTLQLTGGKYIFGNSRVYTYGGTLELSGDASTESLYRSFDTYFGTGTLRVKDNAVYKPYGATTARIAFTPTADFETCRVEVSDNAYLNARADSTYICGYDSVAGYTRMTLRDNATAQFGNALYIGQKDNQNGELIVTNNAFARMSYYKTIVGGPSGTCAETPATGILRVVGGAYENCAWAGASSAGYFFGVGVGLDVDTAQAANVGHLYLSGTGAITNSRYNAVGIGVGAGRGWVHQTGGLFKSNTDAARAVTVLGFRGGEGIWDLADGTYEGNRAVYVGGVVTNVLGFNYATATKLVSDRPGFGTLRVTGGAFKTTGDFWVSQDGQGIVELSGTGQVCVCNAYFTNSVNRMDGTTKYASILKFKLTDGGCGSFICTQDFTASNEAQLEVDVTDAHVKANRFALIQVKAVKQAFLPENVTLKQPLRQWEILATSTGYVLHKRIGTAIIFR